MKFEIDEKKLHNAVVELIRRASTQLPADVISAMEKGRDSEEPGSPAQSVLKLMLENAQMAREDETPICQDTGTNIYYVTVPVGVSLRKVEKVIVEATKTATEKAYLRPNMVDSITGRNTGDNSGVMYTFNSFRRMG